MSMFERSSSESPKNSGAGVDAKELSFPDDFSLEEMAFAREMHEVFAIGSEELPPFYVQTLLSEQRHPIPAGGFEQRIVNRVFAHLGLSRLLLPRVSARPALLRRARAFCLEIWHYLNRPLAAATGLALFFMAMMVIFASPSFAQGLRILFDNTGAVEVKSVPANVQQSAAQFDTSSDNDTMDPSMPLFWLGLTAGKYEYQGLSLQEPATWSKGVIVDLRYSLNPTSQPPTGQTTPGQSTTNQNTSGQTTGQAAANAAASQGSGALDIREFRVADADSAVLQVVEDGSATPIQVNGSPAVYVNGMWVQSLHDHVTTYQWQSGTHCLLILELNGVVLWITGDPRDGLTMQTMAALASQLVSVSQAQLLRNYQGMIVMHHSLPVFADNGSDSEVYCVVRNGTSPENGCGQFLAASSASGAVSSAGG